MLRTLFLIPLVLCIIWFLYLRANGYTMKQGKKGFVYILAFSAAIAGFYTLLMLLTNR